jgi:hypothetical protein
MTDATQRTSQAASSHRRSAIEHAQRPRLGAPSLKWCAAAIAAACAALPANARNPNVIEYELAPGCEWANPAQPWNGASCGMSFSVSGGGGAGGGGASGGGGGGMSPGGPIGPYVPDGPLNPDLDEERCTTARIRLEIRRYLGPILESSDPLLWPGGILRDADELIDRGQILPTQRLTVKMSLRRQPECAGSNISFVFNNKPISPLRIDPLLSASNGELFELQFDIPSDIIHFSPLRGNMGAADPRPIAAVNRFEAASSDPSCLCVTIRDVELELRAMSPVVLVHGILGSGDGTFSAHGMQSALDESLVLYDNSLTQPWATNTIARDGARLMAHVPAAAESFGSDTVHLVVHSKGGLDARYFLEFRAPRASLADAWPQVVSLVTINTPHNGSAIADIVDAFSQDSFSGSIDPLDYDVRTTDPTVEWTSGDAAVARLVRVFGATLRSFSTGPGYLQLKTGYMQARFPSNISALRSISGATTDFWAITSNADRNSDWELSWSESSGMRPGFSLWRTFIPFYGVAGEASLNVQAGTILDQMFRFMSRYRRVGSIFRDRSAFFGRERSFLMVRPWSQRMPNDCVVAMESGLGTDSYDGVTRGSRFFSGDMGRDHSGILNDHVANSTVVPWLITSDVDLGGLRP